MKKIDTLNKTYLKPRKQTVDFLLSFSRSISVLKPAGKKHVICKN